MKLTDNHLAALDKAESLLSHSNFCPYLELKELLPDTSVLARRRFRVLYTQYYGLNAGGLTDNFKTSYFHLLFEGVSPTNRSPNYATLLNDLYEIPRKKGDKALQLSFVSKLVAMHDEARPIYDRHVLSFFGKKAPAASKPRKDRIDWYVSFLDDVAEDYAQWANDSDVKDILNRLKTRDSRLCKCHVVRLLDFLVWKVGNQKLLG